MANRDSKGRFVKGHDSFAKKGMNAGRRNSPETEFKKGQRPWNKGRGKWRECQYCGKKMWVQRCLLDRKKFCSKDCAYKGRELKKTFEKGDKHPAWKNGESLNPYPSRFNPRLKKRVKERDNYTCQLCGITEEEHLEKVGRPLCVNHIDFNKQNCKMRNLNTLCISCNCKVNWKREKWTSYFMKEMEVQYG